MKYIKPKMEVVTTYSEHLNCSSVIPQSHGHGHGHGHGHEHDYDDQGDNYDNDFNKLKYNIWEK